MKKIVYVLIFLLIFSGCASNGKKENNEVDSTQKIEKVGSDAQKEDETSYDLEELFADGNGMKFSGGGVKKIPYVNTNTFIDLFDYVRENSIDIMTEDGEIKVDKVSICKDKEINIYCGDDGEYYAGNAFIEGGDVYPEIFLMDLNKNDDYREIGVSYWGPNWNITIYGYDGEKMIKVASLEGTSADEQPYLDPETGTVVWNTLGFLPEGAVYSTLKIENNNFYRMDYKDIKEYVMDRNVLLDGYFRYNSPKFEGYSSIKDCIFLEKGDKVKILDIIDGAPREVRMEVNGEYCYAYPRTSN